MPSPPLVEEDAAAFVAPRPRSPGTPSPEALARLRAAVSHAPSAAGQRPAAPAAAPAPRPAAAPAQAPRPQAEKPRFGINSLINRMTGHGEATPERPIPAPSRPQVSQAYDDEAVIDPEQERIEIPAFLRRQAN